MYLPKRTKLRKFTDEDASVAHSFVMGGASFFETKK
jgi:hypothetical protein